MFTFEIPGKPRAKQSARAVATTNGIRFYQPTEVVNYHARIGAVARTVITEPLTGAVALRLSVVLRTPVSWSKTRKARLNRATVRPDLDNTTKAFMDGLNGIAWVDDRQVIKLEVEKHYGDRDAVIVTVVPNSAAL